MNEELLKELIKLKMYTACEILDFLPPKVSEEVKNLGRIVLEGINESTKEMKEQQGIKSKPSDKLDNVPIE